jgi:hypothetical protein
MAKSEGSARGKNKNQGRKMRTALQGSSSGRGHTSIDPRIQNEIGKHLRAAYDDVINEPVPEKFIELLEKLEQSAARKG